MIALIADALPQTKHCPRCQRDLSVEVFNRYSKSADGCYYICKGCRRALEKRPASEKRPYQLHHSEIVKGYHVAQVRVLASTRQLAEVVEEINQIAELLRMSRLAYAGEKDGIPIPVRRWMAEQKATLDWLWDEKRQILGPTAW